MQRLGFLSTLSSGLLSKTLKISVNTVKKVSTLEWNLSLQGFLYPLLQGEVHSFCQAGFTRILGMTLPKISPRSVVIFPNICMVKCSDFAKHDYEIWPFNTV